MLSQGWPLTGFADASAIAIAYLCFVIVGSAVMKVGPSEHDHHHHISSLLVHRANIAHLLHCRYEWPMR